MGDQNRPTTRKHPRDKGPAPGREMLVALARKVTDATDAPVVGGIAVILHGGGRSTSDIDIYSADFWATHEKLEDAGIKWNSDRREHLIEDVPVYMVGDDSLGGPPKRISVIDGVRVIGLADLIKAKLTVGLVEIRRSKDIAHVIDLIERIPLKKDFAPRLPKHMRGAFKELVDQVHGPRRTVMPPAKFWKKYA